MLIILRKKYMRGCKQVMQKVNLGSLVLPTNGYNKQKQSVPRLSPNLSFITEVKEEPGNEATHSKIHSFNL